ncbi:MAG: Rpn family recombination-promoting nuclease/putative transposase, partial [Parabacteroides sp.]|nr:Rpn family recombination-promoting nuclease/putative transposase [Parabacteroides sp.]
MVTNQSKPTNRPNGDEMFINPFTDYGFKRIFGTEISKDLLIEFLNSLIPEAKIEDLAFCNVEQVGPTEGSRRAFFDILCRNSNNEYILVEMQRKSQEHFQDRILFYTSFLIQNQMTTVQRAYRKIRKEMKQGLVDPGGYPDWNTDWLYHMKHIYVVCFLGYTMFKEYPETYRWDVLRMDKKHHVIFGDA